MVTKKEDTTKKAPAKKPAAKKPVAAKKKTETAKVHAAVEPKAEATPKKATVSHGRYVFATGRRKTSVANVRLFTGKGANEVNRKALDKYFSHYMLVTAALKPFQITGKAGDYYFYATINGGGINSQAHALQHGIAQALSVADPELRKQLKANSMLTRDDRKKERKKPGLRRARRAPQWAKR